MSDSVSTSSGVAARYATALFDLAKEAKKLASIEKDMDHLSVVLEVSDDFNDLINSPIYSRKDQAAAISAVAKKMKLSLFTSNTLALMAQKRRLFVVPALITSIRGMMAEEKGEVTAEVTSAQVLTQEQSNKLSKALTASIGKDVKINLAVDESLIGGLIVKLGSKMIDSSIRSKLSNLQNIMKEVG